MPSHPHSRVDFASTRWVPLGRAFAALLCLATWSRGDEREVQFESRIRPLLAQHCFSCHGESRQQGDLRLDRRERILGAGDMPGVVVAGQPAASRLIQVIRYSGDDVQMPPQGKLSEEDIALLTAWVESGAYWPEESLASAPKSTGPPRTADGGFDFAAAAQNHWAFCALDKPLPAPVTIAGAESPIDRWLLSRLTERGLTFSPPADRRTLLRRATFDLWGVPPTWEQVEEFVRDLRPDAWPRQVERLLASPLYGQRWGRHWLDVARYADTKGYVFTENHRYPFSYTYRDYVVDALNADKPYDRFVLEQLAADRLGLPERDPALAAQGFITVGPRMLNREPDIIDDRIDLVSRGLQGLTVGCARCHDHKYDPVPAADYYSLYGVFASSTEPTPAPLASDAEQSPGYRGFVEEREKRQQAVRAYEDQVHAELLTQLRERAGDYLLAILKETQSPGAAEAAYEHGQPREKLVALWQKWLERPGRNQHPVFRLSFELAKTPADQFSAQLASKLEEWTQAGSPDTTLNARLAEQLRAAPPANSVELARLIGRLLREADAEWKAAQQLPEDQRPQSLSPAAAEELRLVIHGSGSVTEIPDDQRSRLLERDHRDKLRELERKVEEWEVDSPDAPPRAMVLADKPQPVEPVVFIRGDVNRHGDRVPRQAPRILTGGESRPFPTGSGRLELAETIVAPDNPLTARVIVNRVWAWHFGRGIIATASDFGLRGELPTHPELLDWLAWTFLHEDGWSLKALHRRILLSAAYQQSSATRSDAAATDPENQLYWRFPRQRLEFEPLRDAYLAAAGRLDPALGGRPVEIEQSPFSNRRSVYARIDRNNFSSLLRTFDYPSPDATSPGRPVTTVPQQALFALNSPFVRAMAEDVAQRAQETAVASVDDPQPQLQSLYRNVLARDPSENERQLAVEFLRRHPEGLTLLAQSLLLTNEFAFVD